LNICFFPSSLPRLVEAHVFSFVIGRAFVTDVEKLRIHSKGRSLRVADVFGFFSDITEVCIFIVYIVQILNYRGRMPSDNPFPIIQLGICPGSNFLYAVEVLVTEVSGIFEAKLIQAHSTSIYILFHVIS
jgi:WD repeat and FYVE domain-containing protein 3